MRIISNLLALPGLHLLPAPSQTVRHLIELLKRNPVSGAGIFDLQIVATMQAHGISRIYTFDGGFKCSQMLQSLHQLLKRLRGISLIQASNH